VREILASKQIAVLEHPPYSQDLAVNEVLKGRHLVDSENIRSNTTAALKVIQQNQFQNYFEGWIKRWHWCIASQVEYTEGDHSDIQQ
jgi:hypothetical protein